MSIQVCLISRKSFDYKENGGKKAFLANPKHQYHLSQCGEQDCHAKNKKNGVYYGYPSLSPFLNKLWLKRKWWKEKLFWQIQSIKIMYPIMEKYDCNANNKKNGDCYEYPILSHFTDELWLYGKWWRESFSCKSKASISCIPI